jgi:hypothetical protein
VAAADTDEFARGTATTSTRRRRCATNAPDTLASIFCYSDIGFRLRD